MRTRIADRILITKIRPSNLRGDFYSLFNLSDPSRANPFLYWQRSKHVNAVSLKLHWTACWKKLRLQPLTLNGNFILQIKTFTNTVQCICCVSQLFHRRFNPGTLRIARSAVHTLRSVRNTRVRFLNSEVVASCAESRNGGLTHSYST